MKKLLSLLLCVVLMLGAVMPAYAMVSQSCVQLIHIKHGNSFDTQTAVYYGTLEDALQNAVSGDVIEVFDNVTVSSQLTVPSGVELTFVSGTKRETTAIFGASAFVYTDPNAVTRTVKKNFSGSLFFLGENSKVTFENVVLDGEGKGGAKGGLIYAENGAELTLKRGVTLKNSKLGENSFGGAVYVEKNASLTAENTVFSGNNATKGNDIYAEQKGDVTLAESITADIAYTEAVDISGLNLILTGEIGLVFHTEVPDEYLDGTFVLSCRTGETVTYNISECGRDAEGRYLAKYNVETAELSEPITLTVYDKDGSALAVKEKSVEDYGKVLMADEETTEKEYEAIRTLLNYGHYAQIHCSEYMGWTYGEDYAATPQYGELTADIGEFESYAATWEGHDPYVRSYGMQLALDYKTNLYVYFAAMGEPEITVNGEEAEVYETTEAEGFPYMIEINGISALDLTETFEIVINDKVTLTLSAASYFALSAKYGTESNKNAMLAMYEFYQATVRYNQKPTAPGEDANYGELTRD